MKGIALSEGDEVVYSGQISDEGEIVILTSKNAFKRIIPSVNEPSTRYRKGIRVTPLEGNEEILAACYVTIPYLLAVENGDGTLVEISTEEIPIRKLSQKCVPVKGRDDLSANRIYPMIYRPIE